MSGGGVNTSSVSSTVILTTLQNIVSAINAQTQTNINLAGAQDFFDITTPTIIKAAAGRIVRLSITVAGSSTGAVVDTNNLATGSGIYVISNALGIQVVDLPVQYGIAIFPGTGMTVCGSYS